MVEAVAHRRLLLRWLASELIGRRPELEDQGMVDQDPAEARMVLDTATDRRGRVAIIPPGCGTTRIYRYARADPRKDNGRVKARHYQHNHSTMHDVQLDHNALHAMSRSTSTVPTGSTIAAGRACGSIQYNGGISTCTILFR